jgi:2-keto-3-deoxy-6-phosphogluconate aldolase
MEVTCRITNPLDKIATLSSQLPDFAVGAASLIDFPPMLDTYNKTHPDDPLPTVHDVVAAGADYVVSAVNFSDDTYRRFAGIVPMIPGCGTVTEIVDQFSKGANLCKVFPAKQLGGPAFVKAIDPAIHKTISLVPTGGTNTDNIGDYIRAGVLVLGGSFSMIDKPVMQRIVADQNYDLLARELAAIKQIIDKLRADKWPSVDFAKDPLETISAATGRNFQLA